MICVQHKVWVVALVSLLAGCAEWVPIRSARDLEGQRVRVEAAGKEIVINEVVTCDDSGFIIASQMSDCQTPELTFDTRRDKVSARDGDTKSSVGYAVACILACVFIPAGIVGTAILSSH